MKISVIIPYYEAFPEKKEILERCTKSLKGHDEIIIVWNDRMGFSPAINRGLANAQGDYLFVINDDVIQDSGSLEDLCKPNTVTSPLFNGERKHFCGSAFCLPRTVYEEVGPMFEGFNTSYFDDDDYINKLTMAEVDFETIMDVSFSHPVGGTTLETLEDRNDFFEENKQIFISRWGGMPNETLQYYQMHGTFPKVPDDTTIVL